MVVVAKRISFERAELLEDRALLATITVTSLADNSTVNGEVTLREALDAANSDTSVDGSTVGSGADEIVFAPELTGTITSAGSELAISSDVTITGSTTGSGTDEIVITPALTGTITLDGTELTISSDVTITGPGSGMLTISGDDLSRIFSLSGINLTVEISGLTLTKGSAQSGGAILNSHTLTVSECVITDSSSSFEGGAIYSTGTLTVHQSSLTGNTATFGGAIYSTGSLTVTNSTISGNSADSLGGGINSSGTATVLQSTISGNFSLNSDAGGVGNDGNLIVFNSTISGNSASGSGGGIGNSDSGTLSVIQSTISGNTAGESGGGIGNEGVASINQSTITGNNAILADNGGGIGFTGATTLINTIVAGNTAAGSPDDLAGDQSLEGPSRHNLIGDPNSAGGLTHGPNNNIVGASDGASGRMLLITSTVLSSTLSNAGGLTRTHALLTGSPAINAGGNFSVHDDIFDQDNDADFEEDLPFDQRGVGFFRRVGDGGTPPVDIGAVEFNVPSVFVNVEALPLSVLENGTTNLVFTFTRSVTTGSLTVNFVVSGEAEFSSDYTQTGAATFSETAGTVTFADGQATKTVTVDPTGDTTREGNESVILSVGDGSGYVAGDLFVASGTIETDDFIVVDTLTDVVNGNFTAGNLSLREAIGLANEGPGLDKITFATSLFGSAKTITLSNLGDLDIATSMEIIGPGANLLTISGNNASRIFNVNDGNEGTLNSVTISGLKLINGRSLEPQNPDEEEPEEEVPEGIGFGGAILNLESLAIANCTISGNSASSAGGGIASGPSSHLSVSQSTISGNTARSGDSQYGFFGSGGGIAFAYGSAGSIISSTISGNTSVNGGGLAIEGDSFVTVSQSTISGNTAQYGGGIDSAGGFEDGPDSSTPVLILACTISGNTTTSFAGEYESYGGHGAGIGNEGFMRVVDSTIKDNNAAGDGGGIGNIGTLDVIQSTISGNKASGRGAGIGNGGSATITQSTIVKNTTTAAQGGGGLAFSGSTTLINTIVAGNTFGSIPRDIISEGEELDPESRHNLIGDPNTAGGLTNGANNNIVGNNGTSVLSLASILNTTLANNGGPTLTHNLVTGSKAIGAGGNISVPSDIGDVDGDLDVDEEMPFDQRGNGFVRRFGTGSPVPVDIGAIEFAPPPVFVTIAVSPVSALENGTANLVYTLTRTTTTGTLTVSFDVSGTATFNTDYTATGAATFTATDGTVTFAAGAATKTVTIDPTGDTSIEGNETVELIVVEGAGYFVGTNHHATGMITDDDASFAIAAINANKAEGNTGSTPFTFTVTRIGATSGTASVKFAVTGSGASPAIAADFGTSLPTGTVSFAANETVKTVTINVKGDTTIESDEGFTVTLNTPTGGTIDTATATGTILADDAGLSIAATDAVLAEGNTDDTPFTFTVTRIGPATGAATVNFAVTATGATAANAADFGGTFPSGLVEFANGETTQIITVDVSGDTTVEANETFTVTLSNPVGALLGTNTASGTINNDDTNLSIAATSASKPEGNIGLTAYTFTVTRTGLTSGTSSADFAVSGSGENPANNEDFNGAFPTGTVEFAANETTKVITVNVSGDPSVEPTETFEVTLSDTEGATLGTSTAIGTIVSDDSSYTIAAANAERAEGNTGNTPFTFTVTRNGGALGTGSVKFAVSGQGNTPAAAADFGSALPTGTVNFKAGESTKTITVNVKGDTVLEENEAFAVTLSTPVGGILGDEATANGTILNDDATLTIAADSATKSEGTGGMTPFTFTVTRTGSVIAAATVKYTVAANGSGGTPASATDFVGGKFPTGIVNFAADQATATLTINVNGDTVVEANESFKVTLSAPTGAILGAAANIVAIGTINNDDALLSIAATSAVKGEGNASLTTFTFTVTRTGDTTGESSATFAVTGAATNGANAADFGGALPTGVVEFDAGESSKVITIDVVGDLTAEANEGFIVTLSNLMNAVIGTVSANGTITNDDTSFSIMATNATSAVKKEGNSATTNTAFTFAVTRIGLPVAGSVLFSVAGSGDNPADAADFAGGTLPAGGTLNFTASQTTQTVTVNVRGDTSVEADELFTVTLANPTNATLANAAANGTILNDDTSFSIASGELSSIDEGNAGLTAFSFIVTRAGATSAAGSVKFAVTGTGANPANAADFGTHIPANTVNFAANETQKTITIHVKGDTTVESDEDFVVTLNTPNSGATIANPTATGLIIDDDLLNDLQ